METSPLFSQPPGYRLHPAASAVSHHHVTASRQTKSIPDVTSLQSRDVYRAAPESRGFDAWTAVPPVPTHSLTERVFDEERVRCLQSSSADSVRTSRYQQQRHTTTSAEWLGPHNTTTSATYSLPREWNYGRAAGEAVATTSTATSRLFSTATSQHPQPRHQRQCHHHNAQEQFHEASNSAPADCTAPPPPNLRRARLTACGQGVRATKVSVRTAYHLTTTRRPSASGGSGVKDAQRSQSSRSQQLGASLWVGVAQTIDIRPETGTARTATVDCNNRERCYECSGPLSTEDTCCLAFDRPYRPYHPYCFNCSICKRRLQGRRFFCVNQQLYCENDYTYVGFALYTCFVCSDVIRDRVLRAMGNSYHVDCFRCTACRLPLYQQPFTVDVYSRPYCIGDYVRLYAPKCDVCHEAIIPLQGLSNVKRLVVADKNYHERCLCCQDCGMSLTGISEEHPHLLSRHPTQQQQQQQQSACYALNDRLLCLQCHQHRTSPPATTITVTTTAPVASSSTSCSRDGGSSCTPGTCWATMGYHDNEEEQVTWPASCSLYVDVTLDGDASSSCTTASDDVTAASDDVISSAGSDVTAPASTNEEPSVDSGHCSTVTSSSDTETLDADDDDDDDDTGDENDAEPVKSDTLGRPSCSSSNNNTTAVAVNISDGLSILDLLADSSRVTDL